MLITFEVTLHYDEDVDEGQATPDSDDIHDSVKYGLGYQDVAQPDTIMVEKR